MWRLIAALVIWVAATAALPAETLRVTTWNLEWFPSGKANLRDPIEEPKRIAEAARVLTSLSPDVVLLTRGAGLGNLRAISGQPETAGISNLGLLGVPGKEVRSDGSRKP